MGRPVTRWQILSRDPERTARFYAELFGWRIDASDALGHRPVDTGSREGIQGGIWPAPQEAGSFVQLFVDVPDVADAVRRAEQRGARVLVPATKLPAGDEMAVLLDPLGMSFAVRRSAGNRAPGPEFP
jgi:predicted enzyme related to lactoylglutathione lyase